MSFIPYVPKYEEEFTDESAIKATYNDLELFSNESAAKREIHRRDDLFLSIANLLDMKRSSIYDESLEYLVLKSGTTFEVKDIIDYIKDQESSIYEETAFKKIEKEDFSYITERSLRELIGINSYFNENDVMLEFNELNNQVISNITFEIEKALKVDPTSTNLLNIEGFLKKYENQMGIFWTSLREKIIIQNEQKIYDEKERKEQQLKLLERNERYLKFQIAFRKEKRKKELAASSQLFKTPITFGTPPQPKPKSQDTFTFGTPPEPLSKPKSQDTFTFDTPPEPKPQDTFRFGTPPEPKPQDTFRFGNPQTSPSRLRSK
jgi:hypothetical protein